MIGLTLCATLVLSFIPLFTLSLLCILQILKNVGWFSWQLNIWHHLDNLPLCCLGLFGHASTCQTVSAALLGMSVFLTLKALWERGDVLFYLFNIVFKLYFLKNYWFVKCVSLYFFTTPLFVVCEPLLFLRLIVFPVVLPTITPCFWQLSLKFASISEMKPDNF